MRCFRRKEFQDVRQFKLLGPVVLVTLTGTVAHNIMECPYKLATREVINM
jgi:hypothetical protein